MVLSNTLKKPAAYGHVSVKHTILIHALSTDFEPSAALHLLILQPCHSRSSTTEFTSGTSSQYGRGDVTY